MITENLSTLKIHNLTKEQYERELAAGRIDENALYLTPYEEQVQADWSQTDETAVDYIKNKTYLVYDKENMCISFTDICPIDTGIYENDDLPNDFPFFTVYGESVSTKDFLITPHTSDFTNGYLFITNHKGEVKWYKNIPAFGYNFKQYLNSNGNIRYSYQVSIETMSNINAYYEFCYGVLLDENKEVIDGKDNIRMLASGTVEANHPLECHTFIAKDDNHYIVTTANCVAVSNLPEDEYVSGTYYVVNNAIQEQKDGEVVWHIDSVDYPELYSASVRNNNFDNFTDGSIYTDYAHINSVAETADGNILVSFRNIGIVKFNKETKEIMWIMGTGHNDISGIETSQLPLLQHDIQVLDDGSFTIFDNSGSTEGYTRIVRYIIDDEARVASNVEVLNTVYPESNAMGSATLIDSNINTYDIVYGMCSGAPAFEEYDFDNGIQKMSLTFNDGHDLYNIARAIEEG